MRISQGWTPFTRDWAQQVASTFRAAVESFAGSSLFNVLVGALSHHRAEFSAISEWNDELWNSLNSLNSLCVCRFFGQKEYNWLDPVWYQGMLKEVMRGRLRAQLCPDCWIHRLWTMKPLPKPWSMWGAIGAIGGAVGTNRDGRESIEPVEMRWHSCGNCCGNLWDLHYHEVPQVVCMDHCSILSKLQWPLQLVRFL